jgi:hypothetical protein
MDADGGVAMDMDAAQTIAAQHQANYNPPTQTARTSTCGWGRVKAGHRAVCVGAAFIG